MAAAEVRLGHFLLSDSSMPSPAAVSLLCLLRSTWPLPVPCTGLCSSPDPGDATSAGELYRKLSQKKEKEWEGGSGGGGVSPFFVFFFHLTAGLVRWMYSLTGQTNGKPRERQGCTGRSGGGKTAPMPDYKLLDQISSFPPARRTSSYGWGTDWTKLDWSQATCSVCIPLPSPSLTVEEPAPCPNPLGTIPLTLAPQANAPLPPREVKLQRKSSKKAGQWAARANMRCHKTNMRVSIAGGLD